MKSKVGTLANCSNLNRDNSAADSAILLKFSVVFEHVTVGALHTFKVTGSQIKVTASRNVSAVTL